MNRKLERKLICAMGIWQIIDGIITIFFYGLYQQKITATISNNQIWQIPFFGTTPSSIFMFICTFGTLLIGLGMANLVISKRYVKDNHIVTKIGVYLIVQGLFSYMILDVLSLALAMTSGIILLAKNKGIKYIT